MNSPAAFTIALSNSIIIASSEKLLFRRRVNRREKQSYGQKIQSQKRCKKETCRQKEKVTPYYLS
jgi:hypothetical protein